MLLSDPSEAGESSSAEDSDQPKPRPKRRRRPRQPQIQRQLPTFGQPVPYGRPLALPPRVPRVALSEDTTLTPEQVEVARFLRRTMDARQVRF